MLFPVQIEALRRAGDVPRFGYFLEMGLGKTLLVLHEFKQRLASNDVDILMVFCPNSLIATWKGEVEKHGFPFKVVVKPELVSEVAEGCVILYNYESIIATAGKLIPMVLAQHRTMGVFDESIQIKNHQSARWKKIASWESRFSFVRLLSGRPMVQSPLDLWSQLALLHSTHISASPYAFRNTYCEMGGWQNKVVVGTKNIDRLRDIVRACSFTATKKTWTDLPDKLYTDRTYEMTPEQQKLYKKMLLDMVIELQGKSISVQQAVHKYSKLQQVGSGMMIDEEGHATSIMPFKDVPKVKLLNEVLKATEGKTIVFAHYRASVEALAAHYGGPVIRGGMTEDELRSAVDQFNNGLNGVLVAQLAAAKYGLTLLGNEAMPCHTTIYFENSYSLDARIQSEDRNHRIGQKNNVLYVDLIGTPVERKIIGALQRKDNLSNAIVGAVNELTGSVGEETGNMESING